MRPRTLTILEEQEQKQAFLEDYVEKGLSLREIGRKYGRSHEYVAIQLKGLTPDQKLKAAHNRLDRAAKRLST